MKQLVYFIEDSRWVGIWPSEVEDISQLARTCEFDRVVVVDQTMDGFFDLPTHVPHIRLGKLEDLEVIGQLVVVEEPKDFPEALHKVSLADWDCPNDCTVVFGSHNGLKSKQHFLLSLDNNAVNLFIDVNGPVPVRDCIACVLLHKRY